MKKSFFNRLKKSTCFMIFFASLCLCAEAETGTDFSGEEQTNPWSFKTSGAEIVLDKSEISGNNTEKLMFSMKNQKGGRIASKTFEPSIAGKKIEFSFDWFPGKINDKDKNPAENGGQISLKDSNGTDIFILGFTHNGKFFWSVGSEKSTELGFVDAENWYNVTVEINVKKNKLNATITKLSDGKSEKIVADLKKLNFSSVISKFNITGIRTSGNNITWTTYLDNVKINCDEVSPNAITEVEPLPYLRKYVGSASSVKEIGLPSTVKVTLADKSESSVSVSKWKCTSGKWNGKKSGVYTFEGKIKGNKNAVNELDKKVTAYVYNRLSVPISERFMEKLDRGFIATKSENGIFLSWRIPADEYLKDVSFSVFKNDEKIAENIKPGNFLDESGKSGDVYRLESYENGSLKDKCQTVALDSDYISLKLQKPADGQTSDGTFSYSANDATVGDLDGDGSYEIIVKWYPSNAMDSSLHQLTGPTIFDAYKFDGTPLWRINMGLNLTSGAHYNQIVVADFNSDGKSEIFLKTADGTTVYGVTNRKFDETKIIGTVGNPTDNGKYISMEGNSKGHVTSGKEYVTFFRGEDGKILDTKEYAFPVGDPASWGDTWYNRSDRFNACAAYVDGKNPSAIIGRGYYARTTLACYDLENDKIILRWSFDSEKEGKGGALGNHNIAAADVDNDGKDEIIAGDLTLDEDGSILYMMDGEMMREKGSHADALHVGAFYPDVEGLFVWQPREIPAVASLVLHDAATGEAKLAYFAAKDAGRGIAANITKEPGYEVWGAGGKGASKGGAVYDVYGKVVVENRANVPSMNFKIYWDGDLLHELLDDIEPLDNINISKFNESSLSLDEIKRFTGTHSNNGTKANPSLQADILGDWREEVIVGTDDDSELRIYTTTIPTQYRIYTLMHDPLYRLSVAWQNSGYNQPPCLGFYLGEDVAKKVKDGKLPVISIKYPNK